MSISEVHICNAMLLHDIKLHVGSPDHAYENLSSNDNESKTLMNCSYSVKLV